MNNQPESGPVRVGEGITFEEWWDAPMGEDCPVRGDAYQYGAEGAARDAWNAALASLPALTPPDESIGIPICEGCHDKYDPKYGELVVRGKRYCCDLCFVRNVAVRALTPEPPTHEHLWLIDKDYCAVCGVSRDEETERQTCQDAAIIPDLLTDIYLPWTTYDEGPNLAAIHDAQDMRIVEGEPAAIRHILKVVNAALPLTPEGRLRKEHDDTLGIVRAGSKDR